MYTVTCHSLHTKKPDKILVTSRYISALTEARDAVSNGYDTATIYDEDGEVVITVFKG